MIAATCCCSLTISANDVPCAASVVDDDLAGVLGGNESLRARLEQDHRADEHRRARTPASRSGGHYPAETRRRTDASTRRKPLSVALKIAAVLIGRAACRKRLHSIGVSVSDTKPETRIATRS